MKKSLLFYVLTALIPLLSYGQEDYSFRYGRILDSELQMQTYDRDTSAHAVFIYEKVDIYYDIGNNFRLMKEYSAKIKILGNEGTSWADIVIPYYENSGAKENVHAIDASAYNLENGKVVKTQLKRQMIFRERVNENMWVAKFSIPDVRAGTVIEFRYKIHSDFISDIPELEIQHEIPVIYSHSRVGIPEWFNYKMHQSGFYPVKVKNGGKSAALNGITYNVDEKIIEAEHIPALKSERFVWSIEDLRAKMMFELSGYRFPGSAVVNFSNTWEAVYGTLEKTDFQRFMKMSCPFPDVIKTINAQTEDKLERARAVLKYVQANVKWNERYRLISEPPRTALKDGSGSSGAINFLIMSGLRECGLNPVPVLLNPRSYGRMPLFQPSLQKINSFVIMIELPEGTFFIDGTNPYADVGVLPPDLLVDRARIFGFSGQWAWVDLSIPPGNSHRHLITAQLEPGGKMKMRHVVNTNSTISISTNEKYFAAESEDKYIEELENNTTIVIDNYKITGAGTTSVVEELEYVASTEALGSDILIKAVLIDFMQNNILTEQDRKLPIEFDFPYMYQITGSVILPENYTLKDMPESINLMACEEGLNFTYITQSVGNILNLRMTLKINRAIFAAGEYDDMRTFFGMVSDKCNERIVLAEI